MSDEDLLQSVRSLLFEYVKSPALSHIRDPYAINKLAQRIMAAVTGVNPVWRKWGSDREAVLRSAADCWIPADDMRAFLNEMPGPVLTLTDVKQRLRAMQEEDYASPPDEIERAACLTIFEAEKSQGTELPAIIGAIQEHLTAEWLRRHDEEREARQRQRLEESVALEQRFLSGADCKWTPVNGSTEVYCRVNARTYRLARSADKMWKLQRVRSVDDEGGVAIGTYRARGDAAKALAQVAYQPEARG
jgi:hypothetical protein